VSAAARTAGNQLHNYGARGLQPLERPEPSLCEFCYNAAASISAAAFLEENEAMKSPALAMATILALVPLTAASADRPPTNEEQAQIEAVLKREGFTAWGKIELDDETWEVDDAEGPDGRKYDVELDTNFVIIDKKKLD
jgi:hypothetical protein